MTRYVVTSHSFIFFPTPTLFIECILRIRNLLSHAYISSIESSFSQPLAYTYSLREFAYESAIVYKCTYRIPIRKNINIMAFNKHQLFILLGCFFFLFFPFRYSFCNSEASTNSRIVCIHNRPSRESRCHRVYVIIDKAL